MRYLCLGLSLLLGGCLNNNSLQTCAPLGEALVGFTVELKDHLGDPLYSDSPGRYQILPGSEFQALVFADDLRTNSGSGGGVRAGYADLTLASGAEIQWMEGSLVLSPHFPQSQLGEIGLSRYVILGAGGASLAPLGADPKRLLYSVSAYVPPLTSPGVQVDVQLSEAASVDGNRDILVEGEAYKVGARYGRVMLTVVRSLGVLPSPPKPVNCLAR